MQPALFQTAKYLPKGKDKACCMSRVINFALRGVPSPLKIDTVLSAAVERRNELLKRGCNMFYFNKSNE